MLRFDLLRGQEALNEVSDDALKLISELSEKDESAVIGARIKQIYNDLDADIEAATGIKKDPDVKTYDYMKSALSSLKDARDDANGTISSLQSEVESLKGNSDNKDLHAEADKYKSQVKSLQEQLQKVSEANNSAIEQIKSQAQQDIMDTLIDAEVSKIQFPDEYSDFMREAAVDKAKSKLREIGSMSIRDVDGKKTVVFLDENDLPIASKADFRKPQTVTEAFSDIVGELPGVTGSVGTGGRTQPSKAVSNSFANQREATEAIRSELLDQGFVRDTMEFQEAQDKLYAEYGVSKLPF